MQNLPPSVREDNHRVGPVGTHVRADLTDRIALQAPFPLAPGGIPQNALFGDCRRRVQQGGRTSCKGGHVDSGDSSGGRGFRGDGSGGSGSGGTDDYIQPLHHVLYRLAGEPPPVGDCLHHRGRTPQSVAAAEYRYPVRVRAEGRAALFVQRHAVSGQQVPVYLFAHGGNHRVTGDF